MIRLRRTLERGRAHAVFGPILLVAVVLLLAMVGLHAAHDGWDAAAEFGAMCLGLATVLGLAVLELPSRHRRAQSVRVRGDRGPPRLAVASFERPLTAAISARNLPLRR